MLSVEDKEFVNCKFRREFILPKMESVPYLGLRVIKNPYSAKKYLYKFVFLRNYSESLKYNFKDKTRLGFQDSIKGYKDNSNWKELSFEELDEFIKDSIENEEVFSSIIINNIRYNNAIIYKTVGGNTAIKYEYSNKE